MVRRGSTVRVRQRAYKIPAKRGFLLTELILRSTSWSRRVSSVRDDAVRRPKWLHQALSGYQLAPRARSAISGDRSWGRVRCLRCLALEHAVHLQRQRCEALGARVRREIVAQPLETARAELETGERIAQRRDGGAVDRRRVQEPALLLILVVLLLDQRQVAAYLLHLARERAHRRPHL